MARIARLALALGALGVACGGEIVTIDDSGGLAAEPTSRRDGQAADASVDSAPVADASTHHENHAPSQADGGVEPSSDASPPDATTPDATTPDATTPDPTAPDAHAPPDASAPTTDAGAPASCAPGTWDHDRVATTPCVAWRTCEPGTHVSVEGTATSDRTCAACAGDSYSDTANAPACKARTVCEAGTYVVVAETPTSDRSCGICPAESGVTPSAGTCFGTLTAITAGWEGTCGVLPDGRVRCWGNVGDQGPAPRLIDGVSNAVQVALGSDHACVLGTDGAVRCWGSNGMYQLGNGTTSPTPGLVTIQGATQISRIAANPASATTLAIRADGTALHWGSDFDGWDDVRNPVPTPTLLPVDHVVDAAASSQYWLTLRQDGSALIGAGAGAGSVVNAPTAIGLAGGALHQCMVLADHTVRCSGDDYWGQLGELAGFGDVVEVGAGWSSSCALRTDGTVYCWGANYAGQLGDGTFEAHKTPTKVVGLSGVVKLSVGTLTSCGLLADGSARCWGYNLFGQVGDGTTINRPLAVPVTR